MPLFNIRLHVDAHVHQHESGSTLAVLDHLDQLERLMSKLSDKIAKIGTSLDKAIERVQDDVVTLQNKITALQEAVDNDTATPEDLAAIDMLEAKLAALDPVKPDVLPVEPPVTPPVEPPVTPPVEPPAEPVA
jgi:chromosome segregation ATPase